jgi:hypothetical protein
VVPKIGPTKRGRSTPMAIPAYPLVFIQRTAKTIDPVYKTGRVQYGFTNN